MNITFDELCKLSRLKQRRAVCEYLNEKGIKYYLDSKGYPWTTQNAIDAPLIGRKKKSKGPNFAALT